MKPEGVESGVPEVYSKLLARFQHRLLPYHAGAVHLLRAAQPVGDQPAALEQLHSAGPRFSIVTR
jgi:hypothetical protein